MRSIAVVLLGLCALAAAVPSSSESHSYPEPAGVHQVSGKPYRVADKAFLEKQKNILRLLKYIYQMNEYPDQVQISESYNIEDNLDAYSNHEAVQKFVHYYKLGRLLPRGQVFSPFYQAHVKQAAGLFHIFYSAKDYDTFYKTAVWARDHLNEELFVYSFTVAVLHRKDTQGVVLPPIYETLPYYFYNNEVIQQAYDYKFKYADSQEYQKKYPQGYAINANYTGWYVNVDEEQSLAYFTEDVGLNSFYYYFQADYPYWLGGQEFGLNKDRRGELFYYIHQQILARYYLERLSNDFGNIRQFEYEQPIETAYYPSLRYENGLDFPVRPPQAHLYSSDYNPGYTHVGEHSLYQVQKLEDYERRIRDAIDLGYIINSEGSKVDLYSPQGFNILGNLIQSNPDSPNQRFFGPLIVLAHRLLGFSPNPLDRYKVVPSALEHFQTALRDPIFYQFYKKIVLYFLRYKENLPHYTAEELGYPGVTVESIDVDKLVTYFDTYDADITNAVKVTKHEYESDSFYVKARQYRLNHKPFTYKVNVQSDKAAEVSVRVFIGPKYDEYHRPIDINENRVNFFQLDKFVTKLQQGKNVIERNSRQFYLLVNDRTSYRKLYQQVLTGIKGEHDFFLDQTEAHSGFPNRLVLPKGKHGGQVFQFYVIVSPYKPIQNKQPYDYVVSSGVGTGSRFVDEYPFGYPFDRYIDEAVFYVPNSYFEDVVIFHKTQDEINAPAAQL